MSIPSSYGSNLAVGKMNFPLFSASTSFPKEFCLELLEFLNGVDDFRPHEQFLFIRYQNAMWIIIHSYVMETMKHSKWHIYKYININDNCGSVN